MEKMKRQDYIPVIMIFVMLLAPSCAHVISKDLRDQVAKEIDFREVFKNPDAYKGELVLWSGVVIDSKNRKEGTLLEVL